MKQASKTLYVTNRDDWRAWLERNHARANEVWLIYYKKHTGHPRIPYDDAVEEALCFGWIDSTVRRLDEDRFLQRFTPRKDTSNWCESNRVRLQKLIAEGKMTAAGLSKVAEGVLDAPAPVAPRKKELEVPEFFKDALMKRMRAWDNFNALAPSYRREYIGWITQAKREETRQRRVREAVRLLYENKKLGMK
jgi:uncharacterized protein YdeI (YjbR/CyaY-like superfamily)